MEDSEITDIDGEGDEPARPIRIVWERVEQGKITGVRDDVELVDEGHDALRLVFGDIGRLSSWKPAIIDILDLTMVINVVLAGTTIVKIISDNAGVRRD